MKTSEFILGFLIYGIITGFIVGIIVWLLSLIISVVTFSWIFVLVISGIVGFFGGISFVSN